MNLFYKRLLFAISEVDTVASNTMETELIGIKIAATTGDKIPCTENDNPMKL